MLQSLPAAAERSDPTFDFDALRLAYVETDLYDPYNFSLGPIESDMWDAFSSQDHQAAMDLALQILEQCPVCPDARFVAYVASGELDLPQEERFHRYVMCGLADSILGSGDGKTPETAYQVILIEEEYFVAGVQGQDVQQQALLEENGHAYDVLECVDSTSGAASSMYFNVDIPFSSMDSIFGAQ
jgi:hypothetical protein